MVQTIDTMKVTCKILYLVALSATHPYSFPYSSTGRPNAYTICHHQRHEPSTVD
jgi:hypothetical protein